MKLVMLNVICNGIVLLVFFNFGIVSETHVKFCVTVLDVLKKYWIKNEENGFTMGQI